MFKFLNACEIVGKGHNIVLDRFSSNNCIKIDNINTQEKREQSAEIKTYIRNAISLELLQKFNVKLVSMVVKTGFITDKTDAKILNIRGLFVKHLNFCNERRMINKIREKNCIGSTINKVPGVLNVPYCLGSCTKNERRIECLFYFLGIVCKNVITYRIAKIFIIKYFRDLAENTIYAYNFYVGRLCRR